jgi:cytochrome c peroxidase
MNCATAGPPHHHIRGNDRGRNLGWDSFSQTKTSVWRPDNQMHDLKTERFLNEPARGPIKTFALRGIKDSPPYLHDGRLLSLEDTVEFFNLVLELKLNEQEKRT